MATGMATTVITADQIVRYTRTAPIMPGMRITTTTIPVLRGMKDPLVAVIIPVGITAPPVQGRGPGLRGLNIPVSEERYPLQQTGLLKPEHVQVQ